MTRNEYLEKIKIAFNECFQDNIMCDGTDGCGLPHGIVAPLFDERFAQFCDYVRNELGLCFGKSYHAHGIGNNNETYIYKRDVDADGFVIEKKVCGFEHNYGIYCHLVVAYLLDNDGKIICKKGRI